MDRSTSKLDHQLPGFRFHPNEEELLNFYLRSVVYGKKLHDDIIGFLNIYNHDPKELPGLAKIGEREWYFFVSLDRRHGSGGRPSRTTETGFWKATGSDKKILSTFDPKKMLGLRKTLVFYEGRSPRGKKTDWVMNEYRLPPPDHSACYQPPKDIVLCKIYKKATSLKALEQRATLIKDEDEEEKEVEEMKIVDRTSPALLTPSTDCVSSMDCVSISNCSEEVPQAHCTNSVMLPNGRENLAELQMPPRFNMDSFWMLENLSPFLPMY